LVAKVWGQRQAKVETWREENQQDSEVTHLWFLALSESHATYISNEGIGLDMVLLSSL
jgi:hypothetical protein